MEVTHHHYYLFVLLYIKNMIQEGQAVVRYLHEFQVWHWGIVVRVDEYNLDKIYVMEFTDSDRISLVTLRAFCWYRKYFWVHNFNNELALYGPGVFRSLPDRLAEANSCFKKNQLSYRIDKYNCEYFVRRCVFKDSRLWESQQTLIIGKSSHLFFAKLATVVLGSMVTKFGQFLEIEKEYRNQDIRYEVCPNSSDIIQS